MFLKIKRSGINGEGIGYKKGKPIFVMGAFPEELIEYEMMEENEKYGIGQLEKVIEPSPRRRHPICKNHEQCGGCSLIAYDYKGQARMKEMLLKEALKKYAHYSGKILPMIKNPNVLGYRNALKLPLSMVDGKIEAGMFARNSNEFVKLERCIVHSKLLEKVRQEVIIALQQNEIQAYNKSKINGFKMLVMKEFKEKVQVIFITSPMEIPQKLIDEIMSIEGVVSLYQNIKTDDEKDHDLFGTKMIHLSGLEKMEVEINGLKLLLLPRSFFQLNTAQASNLYEVVKSWTPHSDWIVEAYAGIGAMSLLVSEKAKEVIGIESIQDAVNNAQENAKINGIKNAHFICGDAGVELNKLDQQDRVDTLIVDPPRSGLDPTMRQAIKDSNIKTILYVSCNPSTLGKDLFALSEYAIEKVQPIDMFSQTPHVETVVFLKRK